MQHVYSQECSLWRRGGLSRETARYQPAPQAPRLCSVTRRTVNHPLQASNASGVIHVADKTTRLPKRCDNKSSL